MGAGRTIPLKRGEKKDRNQSLSQRTSKKLVYAPFRLKRENLVKQAKRSGKFRESLQQVKFVLGNVDKLGSVSFRVERDKLISRAPA